MQIYLDGALVSREDARVSVFDHGLLYGDGVFEGIRVYNRRIFRLDAHLDRLWASARAIALEIPLSRAAMADAVRETVRANRRDDAYIRLLVTRGVGELGIDPRTCARPSVIIIVGDVHVYPREIYASGVKVVTAATRQAPPGTVDSRIKSLNYLKNILAKIEAHQAGAHEAILLNEQGYVAECTADNIFVVRGGALLTPSAEDGALAGITRGVVIALAGEAGLVAREARLTRFDVHTADECFVTGTGAELMPVAEVDGRRVGDGTPGPTTRRLAQAFTALARGEGEPLW
ncbi:MAG: branched-chain-amino-acid transaminase [Candidatus Binatia bacterium]